MNRDFIRAIEDSPVIGAVKTMEGLEKCLTSDIGVIFILFGDICNIGEIVDKVKDRGRLAMVHLDLIAGLGNKEIVVDFIKKYTHADGIITTRSPMIRRAKELGLYTVQRFFVLDSLAFESIGRQLSSSHPDVIEVLPGLMPKVIKKLVKMCHVPVIAGGLIGDKEDVLTVLDAGAMAISSTNENTWFI